MEELYYERSHTLLMRDCDRFRRLRPSALLTMTQDGSEYLTERWGVGLGAMLRQNIIWVVAKTACAVTRLPEHEEPIVFREWAGRGRSGIFPFHFTLDTPSGDRLVTGCSLWVLSDLESHSMLSPRIPRFTMPTPEPPGAPVPRMKPVRAPEACRYTPRRVRWSETDINGHLTNTRYVDWMCDLADAEFHRAHPMKTLRVDYRGEIRPDEEVTLTWALDDTRLYCAADGRFSAEMTF